MSEEASRRARREALQPLIRLLAEIAVADYFGELKREQVTDEPETKQTPASK